MASVCSYVKEKSDRISEPLMYLLQQQSKNRSNTFIRMWKKRRKFAQKLRNNFLYRIFSFESDGGDGGSQYSEHIREKYFMFALHWWHFCVQNEFAIWSRWLLSFYWFCPQFGFSFTAARCIFGFYIQLIPACWLNVCISMFVCVIIWCDFPLLSTEFALFVALKI